MKALFAGAAMLLAAAPALAQQSGANGRCQYAGQHTIVWGGIAPEIAGYDGFDWPVTVSGPLGVIAVIPTSQHYYQFPYTCPTGGPLAWITWSSAAPPVNAASIDGQASPPVGAYPPPGYTPLPKGYGPTMADKEGYQSFAGLFALIAAGLAIFVVAPAAAATVGAMSLACALSLGISFSFQTMAADPPDPRYQIIVTPQQETPVVHAPAGTPACYQAFLTKLATASGFVDAMKDTINKLSGAAAAKDWTWVSKQQNQLNLLQAQLPTVELTAQRAVWNWAANCGPHLAATKTSVLGAERRWLKYGLPAPLSNALLQLGVNNYDAWQALFPADPAKVANMLNGGFR